MSNKIHNLIHTEMVTKKRPKKLKTNRCARNVPCNAPLKVYKDSSVVLTQDQLKELELIHQHKLHSYQQYIENISLPRVSEQILEQFKRSIDARSSTTGLLGLMIKSMPIVNMKPGVTLL